MTEVHTDENCININNMMPSTSPSENQTVSNGPHKSATFSHDTVSISESVIAKTNLHTVKKEKVNTNQPRNMFTILEKSYLPVVLIILMCFIVMILQIPTVLYYTDPPSAEPVLLESINLETCSVS